MERLAAYMSAFAKLLGNDGEVRFENVSAGSLLLLSRVTVAAVEALEERISTADLQADNSPAARRACAEILELMATDRTSGSIQVERTPGVRVRLLQLTPQRVAERIRVKDHNPIRGVPVSLSFGEARVTLRLQDGPRNYGQISLPRALAMELVDERCLMRVHIRLDGEGAWELQDSGAWRLASFNAKSWAKLDDTPLKDVVRAIRDDAAEAFDAIGEPVTYFREIRGDPEDRAH